VYKWIQKIKTGEDIGSVIEDTMKNILSHKNYPYYWLNLGVSVEDAVFYAKNIKKYKFVVCKWCGCVFPQKDGVKSCCSTEHYDLHRLDWSKKLSESRQLYNSRDYKQYAIRHNISETEAKEIVAQKARSGSILCKEHWIKKGYSEEEAEKLVSEQQKQNSKRHKNHWIKKGYSEEEAEKLVSEHQAKESQLRYSKYSKEEIIEQSAFNFRFR
jgi:hypothetical protein